MIIRASATTTLIAITLLFTAAAANQQLFARLHPLEPRLVAIGDVHGDIDNFKSILIHAQLIDCQGNWVGEDATVIQLGDVCDRGPHSHTIMEYIDDVLIPQAEKAGGEFIQLLGNHELLNMKGDHRFTLPELIDSFGGLDHWSHQFSPSGVYGARNAKLKTIVVRNGTAFVHAGLLPEHAEKGIDWINAEMAAMIAANDWSHPFSSLTSPVWTRDQVYAAMRKGECGLLKEALLKLSISEVAAGRLPVNRLVVGHTIQPSGAISVFCEGAFIATDVSSSQYMQGGGHLAFVEFRRRVMVGPDGSIPQRYAKDYVNKGTLEGNEKPLTAKEQLYLQILNEGFGEGHSGLEIVGIPTYPPIPWKRHGIHEVLPPHWITTNYSNSSLRSKRGGEARIDKAAPPPLGNNHKRAADKANPASATNSEHHLSSSDSNIHAKMDHLALAHIILIAGAILLLIIIFGGRGGATVRSWMRKRAKPFKATV